jgi:hypothetical protein
MGSVSVWIIGPAFTREVDIGDYPVRAGAAAKGVMRRVDSRVYYRDSYAPAFDRGAASVIPDLVRSGRRFEMA